jgi:hypothetical protein
MRHAQSTAYMLRQIQAIGVRMVADFLAPIPLRLNDWLNRFDVN